MSRRCARSTAWKHVLPAGSASGPGCGSAGCTREAGAMRQRYAAFGPSQAASACAGVRRRAAEVLSGITTILAQETDRGALAEIAPAWTGVMTRRSTTTFRPGDGCVGRSRAPDARQRTPCRLACAIPFAATVPRRWRPRPGIRRELHGRADQPRCAGRMPGRRSGDAAWVFQHAAGPGRRRGPGHREPADGGKHLPRTRRSSRRSPREPSSLFRDRPCRPIFCSARSPGTRITFTIQRGCRPHLCFRRPSPTRCRR